jgi:hypothetical protein
MRRLVLALTVLLMLGACSRGTPTPTPSPTPTATPTLSQLVHINELTCTDLYPGLLPPLDSPRHTLTAHGTIANRDPAPITFDPLLEVLASDGSVAGSVHGQALVILGSRLAEPYTVIYDDPPQTQSGTCRLTLSAGQETIAEATAPIDVVHAP